MARRKLTEAERREWDMQTYDKVVKHPAYPLAVVLFVAVQMNSELGDDFDWSKLNDRTPEWEEVAHEMAVKVLGTLLQTSYVPRPK